MTIPKDLSEVQQLINMGKQRGYVTYEEMNNFLPTHLVSSERLDDVMIMFNLFITFFSFVFIKSTESNSFAQFKIADLADPASFLEAESMTTGSHITCAALCR